MTLVKKSLVLTAIATLLLAGTANATTISFTRLTANANDDVSGQLSALVSAEDSGQVAFTFYNNVVGIASSITDVYFDDGTLLGISTISSSTGVVFSQGATPASLPGGNLASPAFVTTVGFSADSSPPVSPNGVDSATEWLKITFNLINGKSYADTLAALTSGELRIGLRVQSIGELSDSDSYINRVSVPDGGSAAALLGSALLGVGLLRRRFGRA